MGITNTASDDYTVRWAARELISRIYDKATARNWRWRVRDRVCVMMGGNPA